MRFGTVLATVMVMGLLLASQSYAEHFRWAIKTGADPAAETVQAMESTTVAALARLERTATRAGKERAHPPG